MTAKRRLKFRGLPGVGMRIVDGDKVECDRCESVLPIGDASLLEKETNRDYERVLCEACLGAVGVPKGYTLRRDISHLAG